MGAQLGKPGAPVSKPVRPIIIVPSERSPSLSVRDRVNMSRLLGSVCLHIWDSEQLVHASLLHLLGVSGQVGADCPSRNMQNTHKQILRGVQG
eukprot:scaffold133714_cov23-Tisochrysis_lutea.AAC.1